ncbi:hypothetical protein [Microcoleus anatoxicus]|uniref:Uncharacterized protein n=1 Tax=Microcoleus anatoxicus PTRS2 TaxID=2705321 RepID=A0ABU8YS41_9CYAN
MVKRQFDREGNSNSEDFLDIHSISPSRHLAISSSQSLISETKFDKVPTGIAQKSRTMLKPSSPTCQKFRPVKI